MEFNRQDEWMNERGKHHHTKGARAATTEFVCNEVHHGVFELGPILIFLEHLTSSEQDWVIGADQTQEKFCLVIGNGTFENQTSNKFL